MTDTGKFMRIMNIELKLVLRNFLNVFFALILPPCMLLIFGSIYGNNPTKFFGGYGTVDVCTAAYSGMVIGTIALMNLPLTIAQYRERKLLKRFMIMPVNILSILGVQALVNFFIITFGMLILIATGEIVFGLNFQGNLAYVLFAYLLFSISILAFGLFIAGVSPNAKTAVALANIIFYPSIFLSGATMPIEMMPKAVVTISKIFPLTHGIKFFKGMWLGQDISLFYGEILVLCLILIASVVLSLAFFKYE